MKFTDAKNVVIPFGMYQGKTIDETAQTDHGLQYLDWMVNQKWIEKKYGKELLEALKCYLRDPAIEKDLRKLLDEDREILFEGED